MDAADATAGQGVLLDRQQRPRRDGGGGSLSEQLFTELSEQAWHALPIGRITADDCFIALGAGATDTLPSMESIIETAKTLIAKPDQH